MSPSSSAIGMNIAGETASPLRVHRTSDSNPTHIPDASEHDRLVVHLEVVVVDGVAQVVLQLEAGARARVHVRVEQLVPRLAARLGVIHRRVGVAHDLVGASCNRPRRTRCRCSPT